MGYIHLDVKPTNFFVDNYGNIKLGDFGLAVKKETANIFMEGDSKYLAPELLSDNKKYLDYRNDIFSLGMTFLEIVYNVDLPLNGDLWLEIRSDNFKISESFNDFSFVQDIDKNINKLILEMITPDMNKRPKIDYFFNNFEEIKTRRNLFEQKMYRSRINSEILEEMLKNEEDERGFKRSDSI